MLPTPNLPIGQIRTLLDQELSNQLLESFSTPAMLLMPGHRIFAANQAVIDFTGYERSQLLGQTMWLLFPYIVGGAEALLTLQQLPDESIETILHAAQGKQIPISLKIRTLAHASPENDWLLINFEAIESVQKRYSARLHEAQKIFHITRLIQALANADLESLLETGQNLASAEALAVYLGEPNYPRMKRVASLGRGHELPVELSGDEAQQLIKSGLWTRNQLNIMTVTHQIVRSAGFAFLACIPIGERNAPIGILLAADRMNAPQMELIDTLGLIALAIRHLIQTQSEMEISQAQTQQYRSEQLIGEAVFNNCLDGILIVDDQFQILRINPLAELQLGYANIEVRKQPFDNVLIGIGSDRLQPALELALEGVPTHSLGDVRLHRRDGSTFPARIATIPAPNLDQQNYALIIIQDISEHEDIRTRSQQLEQRALLGEITAVFAHEVRNPINNLSTGLQLLERNLPPDDVEHQELINRLKQECDRLTSLMDSVLTFSRTGNYKLAPIDMTDFLERLINRWRPHMARYKVKHHIQAGTTLPPIWGDRRALEQVLTNLISNAIRAMQEHGGTLAFKLSEHEAPGNRRMLQLDVSDTGPGIPPEIRDRIFDPFFTTDPNGTGLGLSISKQIITAHKGSISLTTFPGGTIFHLRLPISDKEEQEIIL